MIATAAEARIAELETALAAAGTALAQGQAALEVQRAALTAAENRAKLTAERDLLRASHERLRYELELLRRRIFVAKAERVDTAQLEMEFAEKLAALDRLGGGLSQEWGRAASLRFWISTPAIAGSSTRRRPVRGLRVSNKASHHSR